MNLRLGREKSSAEREGRTSLLHQTQRTSWECDVSTSLAGGAPPPGFRLEFVEHLAEDTGFQYLKGHHIHYNLTQDLIPVLLLANASF